MLPSSTTQSFSTHPGPGADFFAHPSTSTRVKVNSSESSPTTSSPGSSSTSNSHSTSSSTNSTSPNSSIMAESGISEGQTLGMINKHAATELSHSHHHVLSNAQVIEDDHEGNAEEGDSTMEEDGEQVAGPSGQMAGLSVYEGSSTGYPASGKIRRASMRSEGSSAHAIMSEEEVGSSTKNGKRKAARTENFDGSTEADSWPSSSAMNDSNSASPPPSSSSASLASTSSKTRPPIPFDTSLRRDNLPQPQPPPTAPSPTSDKKHVDIVSYPSADLLRLLASLLEQIAQANDALNQRAAASRNNSGNNTPATGNLADSTEEMNAFETGRFDAAPLNSPITPRYRRGIPGIDGEEDDDAGMDEEELPVTPGIDLQREIGVGGGVEGFMPSLGGAHTPMPLARRRGSSFLTRRGVEEVASSNSMRRSNSGHPPSTVNTPSTASNSATTPPAATEPLTSLLSASSLALASPSATLCFHARNIPAISIEAYLLRILKYCPTTNEVFLSLLVYFDRMARVGLEAQRIGLVPSTGVRNANGDREGPPRLFAIDSFNVHRLVIAGVTVASKFFSDVFYTNSRYAKVGGLPLNELNQLELQFLLLNDFRLVIPIDELQRYADQLLLFWIGRNGSTLSSSAPLPPLPTPSSIPAALTASAVALQSQAQSSSIIEEGGGRMNAENASAYRPRSTRSQPSSSGTSVTSTITPGTPSTPRGAPSSETGSDGEEYHEDDGASAMDQD